MQIDKRAGALRQNVVVGGVARRRVIDEIEGGASRAETAAYSRTYNRQNR
jgi:hypothetical protein